jgi:hypothetical protein
MRKPWRPRACDSIVTISSLSSTMRMRGDAFTGA